MRVCARSAFLVVAEASQLRRGPKFATQSAAAQTHLQSFRNQFVGLQGVGGRTQLQPVGGQGTAPGNPEAEGKAGSRVGQASRGKQSALGLLGLQAAVAQDDNSPPGLLQGVRRGLAP